MRQITEYNFPEDLKNMSEQEMEILSDQIRRFLIEKVSETGGHLASNLGVVELTVALHKVFDSPKDRILWDVGHQSYVHKILTGRASEFSGLRQLDGLSGFPKRSESSHDVYDSGHSSDSLSIALGIAEARDLKKEDFNVIAVIGDGALTGGIAYEALNNAAALKGKMIIIINDNQMSIAKNVGGLTQHLSNIRVSPSYTEMKRRIKSSLASKGAVGKRVYKSLEWARDTLKYTIFEKSLFENLGFKFYGQVDGHNIGELVEFLEAARNNDSPVVIHVSTKKGAGYTKIEENAHKYHGIGKFDPDTFEPIGKSGGPSWSSVFGRKLTKMAEEDSRITAISAAMISGTGLDEMNVKFPDRTFDVGIAEQHAVSFAAGMALNGMRPFVAVYSTFLQRAYDEILTNICLQNLPVVLCIDRAGNVGQDGETHNGQFDLSYLSHMPNMTVMAPANDKELEEMMEYALELGTPCAIRYPRGEADKAYEGCSSIKEGCQEIMHGDKAVIIAIGRKVSDAVKGAEILKEQGISCGVVNARFLKPLDEKAIKKAAEDAKLIVTIEDNVVTGGFGAAVNSIFAGTIDSRRIVNMGWPDGFIKSGSTGELEKLYGLDPEAIADRIKEEL